jgi:hypothetical protein
MGTEAVLAQIANLPRMKIGGSNQGKSQDPPEHWVFSLHAGHLCRGSKVSGGFFPNPRGIAKFQMTAATQRRCSQALG